MVKVRLRSKRGILQPCNLKGYAYQLDPYIGCEHHCCYCYALNDAETDWDEEVLIHENLTDRLDTELSALEPQPIYFGWVSDPYQPAEQTHCQTRQALELLAEQGFPVCVLTKSDLVTRDIDLLASMPGSSAGISVAFQDDRVRRLFEPNALPNERRIEALRKLKAANVQTYALICPVMPFMTDVESLVDLAAPYADTISIYPLSMEAETDRNWQNVRTILDRHFPELTGKYREIAFTADHPYWAALRERLEDLHAARRLDMRINL